MSIEAIPQTFKEVIQVAEIKPSRLVSLPVEYPRGSDRFYQKRMRRGRGRSLRCHHGKRIGDISHGCRPSFTELFYRSKSIFSG